MSDHLWSLDEVKGCLVFCLRKCAKLNKSKSAGYKGQYLAIAEAIENGTLKIETET